MNDQPILTDATLEAMLARRAGPGAPAGLTASIGAGLDALQEARRPWWSVFVPRPSWSPPMRAAWIVALVGLLLAATVSALYVGRELLRRADETSIVVPTVTLTLTQPGEMMAVAWSPDGSHVATGSTSLEGDEPRQIVRVWDASSGEVVVALELADSFMYEAHSWIAYSPDGALLVVAPDYVFDSTTGEELPDEIKEFLAYSPDGTRIAVRGAFGVVTHELDEIDRVAAILDAATGEVQLAFPASLSWVWDAAWSPDGTRLATAYGASVRVWDATTGDLLLTLASDVDGDVDEVRDIEWSPDGTRIATVDPNRATLWNAVSGERVLTIDQRPATPLAWPLNGHAVVSWSPDNTRFATAGVDGAATIWDATSGAQVASLIGSRRDVTDVEWSPDGTRIATASLAGTATIWQVPAAANEQPIPSVSPTEDLDQVGEPIVSDTVLGTITWQVDTYGARNPYPADVSTSHGPVGIDDTALVWLGPDGTVERMLLPAGELSLAPFDDGLIAYGTPPGWSHSQAWRVAWDGNRWVVGEALDVPQSLFGSEGDTELRVAAGPQGVLIVGEQVAVAPDGQHFVTVAQPPGGSDLTAWYAYQLEEYGAVLTAGQDSIGPVFSTADGFIALVSLGLTATEQWYEPVPWFSADGLTWEPAASSSPFGERSWIHDVARRDGRYVAVGNVANVIGNTRAVDGPWAAWVSDDGRTWERLVDLELGQDRWCSTSSGCPIGVTAGDAGWVIFTGKQSVWASADGRAWERLTLPATISVGEPWGYLPVISFSGDTIVVTDSDGMTSAVGIIKP